MIHYISRNCKIVSSNLARDIANKLIIPNGRLHERFFQDNSLDLKLQSSVVDTEFKEDLRNHHVSLEAVPLLLPDFLNLAMVFTGDSITDYFHPIITPLQELGVNINPVIDVASISVDSSGLPYYPLIHDTADEIYLLSQNFLDGIPKKQQRQELQDLIKDGAFDSFCNRLGWGIDILKIQAPPSEKEMKMKAAKGEFYIENYYVMVDLPKFQWHLKMFFAEADFFKCWGRYWHKLIRMLPLESTRLIKIRAYKGFSPSDIFPPVWLDGRVYEMPFRLRDIMHRCPPIDRSLDGQARSLGLRQRKYNIETEEISKLIGIEPKKVKANIDLLFSNAATSEALKHGVIYAGIDVHTTSDLDKKQQELINFTREKIGVSMLTDISDTTGANIEKIVSDMIYKHFGGILSDTVTGQIVRDTNTNQEIRDNEIIRFINSIARKCSCTELQNIEQNAFGRQTFDTVGGLLYTRFARVSNLSSLWFDLDERSAYATMLASAMGINLYIGQPLVATYRTKATKPKAIDVIKVLKAHCERDAWFIRVSGKLKKAINTIIMSNLEFEPKRIKYKDIYDKLENQGNRLFLSGYNIDKVNDVDVISTILAKEIKFGLINADLWDVITLLPDEWVKEYEELLVDAVVYIPRSLCCETIQEYQNKTLELPKESFIDEVNPSIHNPYSLLANTKYQVSQDNICLVFPLQKYYANILQLRQTLKKQKNPAQEIFKLLLNSTYGFFACIKLSRHNQLAANMITAGCRATSWLMMNALNGAQVITDGCTASIYHIPYGYRFKDILKSNPEYLLFFDDSICSGLSIDATSQNWIDENFHNHLKSFYQKDDAFIPIKRFNFDIKDEDFNVTHPKIEKLNITFFSEFFNTNSANYVKSHSELSNELITPYIKRVFDETKQALQTKANKEGWVHEKLNDEILAEMCKKFKFKNDKPNNLDELNTIANIGMDESSCLFDEDEYSFDGSHKKVKARSYKGDTNPLTVWYMDMLKNGYTKPFIHESFDLLRFSDANQLAAKVISEVKKTVVHPVGFRKLKYKIMKAVTRSQYIFLTEKQLKNFEKNQDNLSKLSDSLLTLADWRKYLKDGFDDIIPPTFEAVEIGLSKQIDGIKPDEYFLWGRVHSVGLGFEVLAEKFDGNITELRNWICDAIMSGITDFNAKLQIKRDAEKYAQKYKKWFAALILLRFNADWEIKQRMLDENRDPRLMTFSPDDVKTLEQWHGWDEML